MQAKKKKDLYLLVKKKNLISKIQIHVKNIDHILVIVQEDEMHSDIL